MPYAPSLARGYDGRAATTAALMCLLGRAHSSTLQNRTHRQRPRGTLGAQICRPRRVACAIGARMGRDNSKKPQLPRVARVVLRDGRSHPRAFLLAKGVAVGTRRHAARLGIWQAAAAFFPALFYRSRVPFRAAFFSGPGSISVSLRHSACKAHITSKHSLASKAAAQRIKADICGSAPPIPRNEAKR